MFKRLAVSAMMLAGSMAVFTPAVAQARDYYDHGRYVRREYRDRRDWRERERWQRRDYRPYNYCPR